MGLQPNGFVAAKNTDVVDGGVIIQDSDGIKWKRVYDELLGIDPAWWGATALGISDDLPALNAATKYALSLPGSKRQHIQLRSGIYRITDEWIIGAKFVDVGEAFSDTSKAASANQVEYNKSRYSNCISIRGTGGTAIYADFADTSKLKTAIYYSLQGDTRSTKQSLELYDCEIADLGIYIKGYFNNGIPTRSISSYNGNNAAGITALYNTNLSINNITLFGLKEGMILNNSYFSMTKNISYKFCDRGYFTYQSHASILENVTAANCNKAFEIRSGQMNIVNMYTTACPISLHVANSNSTIKACYLESNNCGEAQIIIGDNPGDPYYLAGNNGLVDGITFEALTVVANKADHTGGVSLAMKESARRVKIDGGSLQSSDKTFVNPNSELIIQGVSGTFPAQTYKRDADATFKSVVIPTQKATTGLTPAYFDVNGKLVRQ